MDFNNLEKKVLGISTRTLVTGLTGTLASVYVLPNAGGSIDIGGYSVPTWVLYAGLFSGSAAINETVKEFMYSYTPNAIKPIYAFQPINTGIAASGLAYVMSIMLGGSWMPSFSQLAYPFAIGLGADLVGSYLTDNLVGPIMDVKKVSDVNKQLLPEPHIPEMLYPENLNKVLDNVGFVMY